MAIPCVLQTTAPREADIDSHSPRALYLSRFHRLHVESALVCYKQARTVHRVATIIVGSIHTLPTAAFPTFLHVPNLLSLCSTLTLRSIGVFTHQRTPSWLTIERAHLYIRLYIQEVVTSCTAFIRLRGVAKMLHTAYLEARPRHGLRLPRGKS